MPIFQSQNKKEQQSNQAQTTVSNPAGPGFSPANTLLDQYEPIIESTANQIYETSLRAPIRLKVLDKFGVNRRGIFRSKELNQFRQNMKDAARQQARDDIVNNVNQKIDEGEKLKKAKHTMIANSFVYKEAKVSVDAIMEQETDKIIENVLPSNTITPLLKSAAQDGVQASTNHKEIMKTILDRAQKEADRMYEPLEYQAVDAARFIVKGKRDGSDAEGKEAAVKKIESDVKQNVKDTKIGDNAFQASLTATTFDSALTKIAPLINQVVPHDGDSGELEIEVKIPVASNAFISLGFGISAEHDDKQYQIGVEANIGAGGSVGVAELKGSIGLFVEAKGNSAMGALNLMSYGMYRSLSTTSPTLAAHLWGMGGKTGFSKLEEAEIWAADVETQLFDDEENYVSVGKQAALDATVETGIYEGEFQLKGQKKTTYNKENLEALNSDEHYEKHLAKLNKDSLTTRALKFLHLNDANSPKQIHTRDELPSIAFGNDIDLDYIFSQEKSSDSLRVGQKNLERRSRRYKEIEAQKNLAISTDHTLSLPNGSIALGLNLEYELGSSKISGEISFAFPEKVEGFEYKGVFNLLFSDMTDIVNSALNLLDKNKSGDLSKTDVNREHAKLQVANLMQTVGNIEEIEDSLESMYDTSIKGTVGLVLNTDANKLEEIEFTITKEGSSEPLSNLDLEVLEVSFSKSSKIASFKKTF